MTAAGQGEMPRPGGAGGGVATHATVSGGSAKLRLFTCSTGRCAVSWTGRAAGVRLVFV